MNTYDRLLQIATKTLCTVVAIICCFSAFSQFGAVTTTNRFQANLNGGIGIAANALLIAEDVFVDADSDAGTSASSLADLVLPAGSQIVYAELVIESYNGDQTNSAKFAFPGSAGYVTLNTTSPEFISNSTGPGHFNLVFDVTNLIPVDGYTSTVVAGGDPSGVGTYAVADPAVNADNDGVGWTLIVVYTNPISPIRSITVADMSDFFGFSSVIDSVYTTIPNITVPVVGSVNASIFMSGVWGDPTSMFANFEDNVSLGIQGGSYTRMNDPVANANNDILNSTIGVAANFCVIQDGVAMAPGNVISRNPYQGFSASESFNGTSCFYDADVMDGAGILPNSTVPIDATVVFNVLCWKC